MDIEKIKILAENLEKNLMSYMENNEDARRLHESLVEIIDKAKRGLISNPIENIPGAYWFLECGLSEFSDLESAYYAFKNAVTIGDSVEYQKLKQLVKMRKGDRFIF